MVRTESAERTLTRGEQGTDLDDVVHLFVRGRSRKVGRRLVTVLRGGSGSGRGGRRRQALARRGRELGETRSVAQLR